MSLYSINIKAKIKKNSTNLHLIHRFWRYFNSYVLVLNKY